MPEMPDPGRAAAIAAHTRFALENGVLLETGKHGAPIAWAKDAAQECRWEGVPKHRGNMGGAPSAFVERVDARQNQTAQLIGQVRRIGSSIGDRGFGRDSSVRNSSR